MAHELTKEQTDIVNTVYSKDDVVKVNAYAGSGKTSTIIEVVKEIRKKDKDSKILYLVFNRSMIEDSKVKFDSLSLGVDCYTTHGFALKRFTAVSKKEIQIMNNIDFSDYMSIKGKNPKYKWAKYKNILDMFNEYCLTYDDLDTFCKNILGGSHYYDIESDIRGYEVDFFKELYKHFTSNGKYTHSMYLKEYACECHDKIQGYKYVFIDEAQDVSLLAMPIIRRIKCDKMYIVGDAKQKIYSFLKAVDVFDKFKGPIYPLSISFRFNDEVCKLANELLSFRYKSFKKDSIKNFHNKTVVEDPTKKTILFRLNSTMFEYAVNLVKELDDVKVKFMDIVGSKNSESFDDTFGEMLYFYDKLLEAKLGKDSEKLTTYRNMFRFGKSKIVDGYIKIAEKEESNLYSYIAYGKGKLMLSLDFRKFFSFFDMNEHDLINVLDRVRNSENCDNPRKVYTLSTSHRSKGLEWEHVKIANDAWSLSTDDEANLCYVAVTRAKHKIEAKAILDILEEAKLNIR